MRSPPNHPAPGSSVVTTAPLAACLPPGTPTWVTPDLLNLTVSTWQPFYVDDLSVDDAVRILQSVGRLFRVLTPASALAPVPAPED